MTYVPKHRQPVQGVRDRSVGRVRDGHAPAVPASDRPQRRGAWVEGSLAEGGVLHRIPGGAVVAVLMTVLAVCLLAAVSCTPPKDDSGTDGKTTNRCAEMDPQPKGCEP